MSTWTIGRSSKRTAYAQEFYSELNLSGISESIYNHAQRIWREFGMKNLGDYHDLYLINGCVAVA